MDVICDGCRTSGRCSEEADRRREAFFALARDEQVGCIDYKPGYWQGLAA